MHELRGMARRHKEEGIEDLTMDKDFVNRLTDYFEPFELMEFLDSVTVADLCYSFPDEIEDAREELEEFMLHGR